MCEVRTIVFERGMRQEDVWFFKKFIRLIGSYVDMMTVYAVGRIINRTLGKYQFKLNEKESEARPNSPVPEIEHRYNVDAPVHPHHEAEQEEEEPSENIELDREMLEYIHGIKTKHYSDPNLALQHELYQCHNKRL